MRKNSGSNATKLRKYMRREFISNTINKEKITLTVLKVNPVQIILWKPVA
jgi:hypothetical protein